MARLKKTPQNTRKTPTKQTPENPTHANVQANPGETARGVHAAAGRPRRGSRGRVAGKRLPPAGGHAERLPRDARSPGPAGLQEVVRMRRRVAAPGQGSARKMAAATFCRLLSRGGGAAALSLPPGARCFGVRTSPTGEKVTHTGQVTAAAWTAPGRAGPRPAPRPDGRGPRPRGVSVWPRVGARESAGGAGGLAGEKRSSAGFVFGAE